MIVHDITPTGNKRFPRANKSVYSSAYTYSFVVPAGVSQIGIKAWGAGGAAGNAGAPGGAGSFLQIVLSTTPGETLSLVVGGSTPNGTASPHGAPGSSLSSNTGGSGGGFSGVLRGSTILCAAAGGGGGAGGSSGGGGGAGDQPGAGGKNGRALPGLIFPEGGIGIAASGTYAGTNGNPTSGGLGGQSGGSNRGGGGGGGGYVGGAGGQGGDTAAIGSAGGGAGGLSYPFAPTIADTEYSLRRQFGQIASAPNTDDPDYVAGRGAGGTLSGGAGGSGLLILTYNPNL